MRRLGLPRSIELRDRGAITQPGAAHASNLADFGGALWVLPGFQWVACTSRR